MNLHIWYKKKIFQKTLLYLNKIDVGKKKIYYISYLIHPYIYFLIFLLILI